MCRPKRAEVARGYMRDGSCSGADAVGCGFTRGGQRHRVCRDAHGKSAASGIQTFTTHLRPHCCVGCSGIDATHANRWRDLGCVLGDANDGC